MTWKPFPQEISLICLSICKHRSAAELVGQLVSERLKAKGIEKVVFDRSGYIYHGRIKAVAEGARKGGLQF